MIVLDTSHTLKIVLEETASTQLDFYVSYIDTANDEVGSNEGTTNDTTDVTLVNSPSSGKRLIRFINVYNADDTSHNVVIKIDDGTNQRVLKRVTLTSKDSLVYTPSKGWVIESLRKFIQLEDTPGSYSNLAGKLFKVNSSETALEASTNTDSEIADAVDKRHTQNTDHIVKDADGDTSVDTEASADEDKIRFKTAGSERVTIDENGNVGIGTTSPGKKLHVNGGIYFVGTIGPSNDSTYAEFLGATGPLKGPGIRGRGAEHSDYPGTLELWFGGDTEDDSDVGRLSIYHRKGTDGSVSELVRITKEGNVGIGTTSPSEKLDVSGNILANNILIKVAEVEVSSNCDYVDFTGLDGNSAWFYILQATIKNPTGSNSEYYLFVEGDTDSTHYYNQYLDVDGTSTTPNRANNPSFAFALAGASTFAVVHITKSPTGYFHFTSHESRHQNNIFLCLRAGIKSNATISNITQLRVNASVSGAIGAGSKFVLYKVRRG